LRRDIVSRYLVGAMVGGVLGLQVVVTLPEQVLWLSLGLFLLIKTWVPLTVRVPEVRFKYVLLGTVSTFLSLFVGITGPLVHPVILREGLGKHSFIGTEATCAGITHLIKVAVFTFSGVVIFSQWQLIVPMVVAAIAGSYVGKKILGTIKQEHFVTLIKVVLTALALRMLSKVLM